MIIAIPLKHIIIDPETNIDLLAIPQEEAVELIKRTYGFLSSAIEVTIEGEVAIISLKKPKAEKANEAFKRF
jgi:hypothetical protein